MSFFKKPAEEPVVNIEPVEEPEIIEEPVKEPEVFVAVHKTTIGKGITFYGDFESKDPLELNGCIKGDIVTTEVMSISETGSYIGNAQMKELNVSGSIEGNIDCETLSSFSGTGKISGSLNTATLNTDPGAAIDGKISLNPSKGQPKAEEPMVWNIETKEAPAEEQLPDLSEEGDVPVTEEDLFN